MRAPKLFLKFLSVFLFLTTFSCENNDNFIETSLEKVSVVDTKRNSTNIRTVNINEISLVGERIKNVIGKDAFSKAKKNGDPIINETNILEITDTLKRRNYSFSMIVNEKKYKGPRLYNLIVGVDSTGRMSDPMVLRFKPKEKFEQEWLDNDLDLGHFTGKVSLHKYTAFFKDNPLTAIGDLCPPEHDEYGDPIICVEDDVSSGGSGGAASDGGSFAPAGGGGEGSPTNSTQCTFDYYWNYCGGSNEGTAHDPAPVCQGDGDGAGWVLEIDCPTYSTALYFLEGKSSDCQDCATGPSGDLAINTFAKSVLKLESSFSNIGYNLSHSELTWLNINDHVAYNLMQTIKNDSWAPETLNLSILNLFREMSQDGWNYGIQGTVGNREALKYKAYYQPNLGESMYLLENGLVLYQSQSERRINKKLSGTIASTEPPTNGYNYIYDYQSNQWYEYRIPPEDYVETDIEYLFKAGFWAGTEFLGRYVVPVEDVMILIDGKDFDGVEQNRAIATGSLLVGFVPGGKVLKPIAKVISGSKWYRVIKEGSKTVAKTIRAIPSDILLRFEKNCATGINPYVDDLLRTGVFDDDVINETAEVLNDLVIKKGSKLSWPEVRALFKRGNDFNKKAARTYEFNEVTLKNRKRLDTYIPGIAIISRKATTLSEIKTSTFKGYLSELITKYPKGAAINAPKFGKTFVNKTLSGDYFLEIPLSNKTFFENSATFKQVLAQFNVDNGVLIKIKYLAE